MLFTKPDTERKYDSTLDTIKHKNYVKEYLGQFANHLHERAECHDDSKLCSPEKETLDKYIPKLKKVKYGTPEYNDLKNEMYEYGSNHHFEVNRHHPEYHENGINDTTLGDISEMVFDWYCASLLSDTTFEEGLKGNKEKYNISDQLYQIIVNTYNDYIKPIEEARKEH